MDTWTGHVSWRTEKHTRISVESDASGLMMGGIIHLSDKDLTVRDYWSQEEMKLHISTKKNISSCLTSRGSSSTSPGLQNRPHARQSGINPHLAQARHLRPGTL